MIKQRASYFTSPAKLGMKDLKCKRTINRKLFSVYSSRRYGLYRDERHTKRNPIHDLLKLN